MRGGNGSGILQGTATRGDLTTPISCRPISVHRHSDYREKADLISKLLVSFFCDFTRFKKSWGEWELERAVVFRD
jgi:hypothetical protein